MFVMIKSKAIIQSQKECAKVNQNLENNFSKLFRAITQPIQLKSKHEISQKAV